MERGAGGGMSGTRGRGRSGRKKEAAGRREDASHRVPPPSPSLDAQGSQASLTASTLLMDTAWVPPSVSLPLASQEQASRGLPQLCPALPGTDPQMESWKHRPFRDHSCAHHLSSCTYFSKHIKLCTGCSLGLGCSSIFHLPGELLVILLVPDQIPLTLRCPFKPRWAGEVTCPSSAWPSTALSRDLRDHPVPSISTGRRVTLTML